MSEDRISEDQQTQRLHPVRPDRPAARPPGPLDLTAPQPAPEAETNVLRLDELFGPPPTEPATEPEPVTAPPVNAEATTWTALPVAPAPAAPAAPAPAGPSPTRQRNHQRRQRQRQRSQVAARLRADAGTAAQASVRRTQEWLGVQDNAIMALTALVGIVLIVVVAALGH